jgi:hypothetical protein
MKLFTTIFVVCASFFSLLSVVTALATPYVEIPAQVVSAGSLKVHQYISTTGVAVNVTSIEMADDNCVSNEIPHVLNPLGTCIDICEGYNYENCLNNLCSAPCACNLPPPQWQEIRSIRFQGSTRCWLTFNDKCRTGTLAITDHSLSNTDDFLHAPTFSVQCYRGD